MPNVSIEDALAIFLLDCQARDLRPATLTTYRLQCSSFKVFCRDVGISDLADIDPNLLRTYFVTLQAHGLRPASIRSHARCLRAFLNFCVSDALLQQTPFHNIRLPKEDRHAPNALTVDEVQRLLDACYTQRDRAIVLCLLDTGQRLGEFAALRVGDVDQTTGIIHLSRQIKSRADRTVFLGQRARAELAAYLAETPGLSAESPLWRARGGGAFKPGGIQSHLRRLGVRVGIHANAHKWRRTFAVWSLRAGIDVYSLQGLMGHSSLDMLRAYLSLSDDDLLRAHGLHSPVDHILK